MFEQENTEVEGTSEEASIDQHDLVAEDPTNGNVSVGKEVSRVADNAYVTEDMQAESGLIINISQVQSIDIPEQFSKSATEDGWEITIHRWCKLTINMTERMRKTETAMIEGDQIIKKGEDLLILHNSPADKYTTKRSTSSLALSRDELLENRRSTSSIDSSEIGKP